MVAGSAIFCYDANGNMTQKSDGSSTSYTYDAENRMTAVSGAATATFVYDGDGNRVKGVVGGVTTTYIGNYFEWTGSTTTMKKYYYAGGTRVAERVGSGTTYYFLLTDHLGSTSITATRLGAFSSELRYKAWGETRYSFGSTPTTFRYTGQREESSLGLYWYNSRWYSPGLSRFVSPDTIIPQPGNPMAWDRYAYTYSNPVNFTDPGGHFICEDSMPYCDPQKLTYDWEIPDAKFISNFEDRPLEIMRAARMNYILLRYQLYFTYGDKVVNSKGKINDQYFIATMISKEFGGYGDNSVYNEALEALSNQYYDSTGDKNQMFCNHNCTINAQIAWATDLEAVYKGTVYRELLKKPLLLEQYLEDATKVMNGYNQGMDNSWMWGNVYEEQILSVNGVELYNGHPIHAKGPSAYPPYKYFIVWGS